ncbi:MAG: glycosyltransferase, partial [Candidatus Syntropharchaeia archaeon]
DGFVVSPRNPSEIADYIQFFRENPLDMKKMGENARKKAMDYSWGKIRENYKEVYRRVLA